MSQYTKYPVSGGGGGGGGTVTSVGITAPVSILNVTNSPITGSGNIILSLVDQPANTIFSGPTTGADAPPGFRALVPADLPTGSFNTIAVYNSTGVLGSSTTLSIDTTTAGISQNITEQPNNATGFFQINAVNIGFQPQQNSPDDFYNVHQINLQLDTASSGFSQGTNGQAITLHSDNITHNGTGDVGALNGLQTNFSLGNGTDPITVNGMGYAFGFGNVAANVTIDGAVQGYGFQPNFNAASTLTTNAYFNSFYDYTNIATPLNASYNSFTAGPGISEITNNHNYVTFNSNPNITTLSGNSSCFGLALSPNIGTMATSSNNLRGVNFNPTVALNYGQVVGLDISVNNVTNYAGVQSSIVVQDITYTFIQAGSYNDIYTIEYANTVLAGNETVTILGNAITVNIESGVSTATQVLAAANANTGFISSVTPVITGVASNAQVTAAAANFAGGIDPGIKKAANFDGDVSINGALSFTGALSIGQLTSYAPYTITSGLGVASVDSLITAPTVAPAATITGTDLLGVNTAMLLTIGAGATVTSNFLGFAALGLPAVVNMDAGSTIDLVEGAVFAISLDAAAGGGNITEVDLCRSLAIPNGATTISRLVGYKFDLPFGDPGTVTWGFYTDEPVHNYMAGDIKVGDGTDTVASANVGIELESTSKAILLSRMTTAQRDAMTGIDGMMIYNTDVNKFQGYASGAWVDFH